MLVLLHAATAAFAVAVNVTAVAVNVTAAADAAAVEAAADSVAAEAALQYLQGAGIRTRDSATADRCAIPMSYTSPLYLS